MMIPRTCGIGLAVSEKSSWKELKLVFLSHILRCCWREELTFLRICRCTAHDEWEQNGARIKSISPTVSDLRSQKNQSSYASKKSLQIKKGT